MENKKSFLSTIWVFVTLNYLYCDLIGLMDSSLLKQYLTGNVDGLAINENFLLYAGILMEIPIAMVLISRVLRKNVNCWTNIMAGTLKTIVMIITLFMGSITKYYVFFASIEIATTLFIVGYAVKWLRQKEV
ncbi:DUF6326 family protein [Runella salmonicolor]|uniref:DUF6326 family protein n=1 Tax=Runella salmonicolor TaxID=2950278 RepID=A0ABT1FSM9_9BACT|nr:DUF6326 family protein [Runella salmonicolor]MCP1384716.1 DUF6326 family protein [Runella salmonicolor]